MRKIVAGIISFIASYGAVYYLVLPTLETYPRLAGMVQRSDYTDEALWLFIFFSLWLFYWQWEQKKIWNSYLYLFYSGYFLLLFIMLFTKAQTYHSFNLNPFELYLNNKQQVIELILNTCYFIPLGCLYGMRAKKAETVVIALTTILGIETLQYLFYLGTFDIWDIMTNFAGCMIGYYFFSLIKKRMAV
ncbi:VanZ family protein [Enterococcus xiangfangensis]|uniref:VanZ family protein n=1 Tax=Enterococcus xiangfangensis TaxID=1296537 RepID=A0ABU3F7K3_9ENTE|nr:VanZ family protein [Enterococcus xiangfangensis]MDT2758637.1 VanZ family protein [Enterococcus xiangfangensis]NBK08292.1 VanZ family protein [Enterococcus asini]